MAWASVRCKPQSHRLAPRRCASQRPAAHRDTTYTAGGSDLGPHHPIR